jgi:signal transduction histidine kinase
MSDAAIPAPAGRRLFTAWTVLAAALVLSLAIGLGAHVAVEERVEARFNAWVEDASGRLQSQIAAQEALIEGSAALFSSQDVPAGRGPFAAYVERLHLDERYPGIRALGYAARVDIAGRERLVERMRREGDPRFEIWPAGGGAEAEVLLHVEPSDPTSELWLGFDLSSEPALREALDATRDRGTAVLSSSIDLAPRRASATPIPGFLLAHPVYAGRADTVDERRRGLRGHVVAYVEAADFFAHVFGKDLEVPVALRVYDGPVGDDGRLLYKDADDEAWSGASKVSRRAIIASGRYWTLDAAALPTLVPLRERMIAPFLAAVGVALSFLLFGLTRSQVRARATAETTVDAMRRGEEVRAGLLATERSARQEAQRLVAALERSNRELDQFAYVASHDLKSPLRGIANLTTWIEEDLADAASAETRKNLELLRGRVRRLEALIDGILSYSRAGRATEPPETVDVAALVREVLGLLDPPPEASVQIGPMPTLETQKIQLEQVLMNLVSNAIKYAGRADVTVRVTARQVGHCWEFSVTDDGPGIAPEYHARVWQMFQTLQTRDQIEATGIGLAVVKKIVESRGGSVSLVSAPGEGTCFAFVWPSELEKAATQPIIREARPVRPARRASDRPPTSQLS